jgi:Cd2+/Zn2+-exporting ATPase
MPQSADYKVHGLDCAEEVAALRAELGRRAGVLRLDFDVLKGRMTVEYDQARITEADIVSAVASTGMRAEPWGQPQAQRTTVWRRYGRLIMTVASGAMLCAGLVVHWAVHRSIHDALAPGLEADHAFPLPSLLLYAGSAIAGAWFVVPKALLAARRFRPDMNLLMTIAVIGAAAIGEWFEGATVAFLFSLALLLEQWSVGRARRAIGALLDIAPPTAWVLDAQTGRPQETPVADVAAGATILIRPGERLPLDGVVVRGETSINQAPITGESMPVPKAPDDEVFAGTVNGEGAIEVKVTRQVGDTMLARIIHMVEQAQARRAQAPQWVDTFARYYTPAMVLLAIAVAVLPPLVWDGQWVRWFYEALVILVIACPCALVISTPVSIVSALTAAARNGVLVKGGVFLELAGGLKAVAMDKTGTLTEGRPKVQRVVPLNGHTEEELLARAAAIESHSEHPLARAILHRAQEMGIALPAISGFRAVKGRGAEAEIEGRRFWIGSHRLVEEKGQETPEVHAKAEELEDAGHTVIAVGNDSHVCGLISVADGIRPNARQAVQDIKDAGLRAVVMLTGDNTGTARAIAKEAGVDHFQAELLPEDKVAAVEALVLRHGKTAMIGDGINDAPAMAASTVGIAMAAMGTDAAIETADIALMSDDLSRLPWLIRHSRRTLLVIRQNIAFSLGLKALFIALALAGVATLWMAIAADMGASLLVIFNGLRLLRTNPG